MNLIIKNIIYVKNIKHYFIIVIFITIFISSNIFQNQAFSQENNNFVFGLFASGGFSDVWHQKGKDIETSKPEWERGIITGGGFFFENMFTDYFGIHSGLTYSYATGYLYLNKNYYEKNKLTMKSHSLILPFYLVNSFGNKIRIDFLYGFQYMHMFYNSVSYKDKKEDFIRYVDYNQFGCGLKIRLGFKITKFIYFYLAPSGQLYFTNFIQEANWRDYLYNYQIETGILFKSF